MIQAQYNERWNTERLGVLFEENSTKNIEFSEQTAYQFYFGSIVPKKQYELTPGLIETYRKYTIIQPNDIVLNGLNLNYDFVSQRVGLVKNNGIITSAYLCLRPKKGVSAPFYSYLFKALDSQKIFHGLGTGIRKTLSFGDLKNYQIPVLSNNEQDQIVRYLDWQVSKINRLISAKKKKIKLLNEYRQTLIDSAVTKGIDGSPLIESGVNWLPFIPQNWKMVYAKQLFCERKEKAYPDDEQLTASQKYGIISQQEFMNLEGRRLTVVMTGEDILKHVGEGDFVISMRSFQGGLEYSMVSGKISSAYVMIIPNHEKVFDGYYRLLLKSTPYIKALQGTSDLVRDGQALRFANFVKVRLPEISLDEQRRIAEFVETNIAKIEGLFPRIQKEIGILIDMRTKLITDVVTGQIDVRNIEIPDYEYVEEEAEENDDDFDEETEEQEVDE